MSFERLLIHTCELILPHDESESDEIEEDQWGRPIVKPKEPKKVKCRYRAKNIYIRDSSGSESVLETSISLLPDAKVDPEMTVVNIRDSKGRPFTSAKMKVVDIQPHYDRKRLHHYTVILKGAE
ncbi:hypothetical protein [Enterococcus sp. AZ109]|uniref:hypothetical protein n=1 Tax=Enterococcus sp. AZ109 TaxID=2774634 RepID=UPI003F2253CB